MNETERQAYLQAMGIQPYFPRVPVPGAKPSPEYAIELPVAAPALAVNRVLSRERADAGSTRPPAAASKQRHRAAAVAAEKATAVVAPMTAPRVTPAFAASGQAEPPDQLQFCLHYYRLSGALAVLDEVPFQQQGKTPDSVGQLLGAILAALGGNPGLPAGQPDQFNWPLEKGIEVTGDPDLAAQQALLGYIAMRQQRDGFQQLLVFSAQIGRFLLHSGEQNSGEQNSGEQHTATPACFDALAAGGIYHITVTHSLQSLLAHPILKRETWGHLQALRQRLQAAGKPSA